MLIVNKIFHITVLLLVYFCNQFVASLTAVFVNNMVFRYEQWRIQDLQTGGPRSSAAGASIEAPKAPRGVGRGFPLPH